MIEFNFNFKTFHFSDPIGIQNSGDSDSSIFRWASLLGSEL